MSSSSLTDQGQIRRRFVVHEHHARQLHFDLRLEIDGTGKSWAVPKGPSMNPDDKRLAISVPDHGLGYFDFEGFLPEGTYGAGEVRIWDSGEYETPSDPSNQFYDGKLSLTFFGKKLRGLFFIAKMSGQPKNWLLMKRKDEFSQIDWTLKTILPVGI